MSKKLYVGIDISKNTLDISVSGEKGVFKSKSIVNNKRDFPELLKWLRSEQKNMQCSLIHICLEATGIYGEDIAQYLHAKKSLKISIINPSQGKAFAKSILLRTKTDKVDAKLLAQYCMSVKPRYTVELQPDIKKLKQLLHHLNHLISKRAELRIYLESITDFAIKKNTLDIINEFDKSIVSVKAKIKKHLETNDKINQDKNLLKSIPGIGDICAWNILCELLQETPNKDRLRYTKRCQAAHAGLAPAHKQSGISVNGKSYICKMGNARLRKALYLPTLSAIQNNPIIKKFYLKLISKGKCKMVAVGACMRKLLMIAIGVLNNQVSFKVCWISKPYYAK